MPYSKAQNEATKKYEKTHMRRIVLKYRKTEYEETIEPGIKRSGLPVATFIKQAIKEKIERDNTK